MRLKPFLLAVLLIFPGLAAAQTQSFDQLTQQAAAARDENDLPRAVALYRQAVEANPQWADGWWYLGLLGYSANDYAGAREALTHYLDLMPSAGPAFALRGLCAFESGDYAASLADIERGIALGAANDQRNEQILRWHEGLLLAHAGRFEEALSTYQILARNAPSNPELLTAIGLAGLRDPAFVRDAPASEQERAAAAGAAAFSFMTGDREPAARQFRELFRRYPTLQNAHYFYGYLLFPHDPAAAIAEMEQELKLDGANVPALALLAWADLLHDDASGALPYARKAASLDPHLFMAQLVAGRALVGTGAVQQGLEHLDEALRLQPDSLEVHIGLAIAYSMTGQRDRAYQERMKCLSLTRADAVPGQS